MELFGASIRALYQPLIMRSDAQFGMKDRVESVWETARIRSREMTQFPWLSPQGIILHRRHRCKGSAVVNVGLNARSISPRI